MARLTNWEKTQMEDVVWGLLKKFKTAAPFPLPLEREPLIKAYKSTWGSEVLSAVDFLHAHNIKIAESFIVDLNVVDHANQARYIMKIAVTTINNPVAYMSQDHQYYNDMLKFCSETVANYKRAEIAHATFERITQASTTAGQILRVAPFITDYMPEKAKEKMAGAQRKSRLPAGIKNKMREDPVAWRRRVDYLHDSLALAHLLPEYNALQNSKVYEVEKVQM